MIHLFPKLEYTVERLGLYMSFLTQRYIVTGQLPENAPEEQLEVIRKLEEEYSSAGLNLISLPRLGFTPGQPQRRRARPGASLGGPAKGGASNTHSAPSGTAPRQPPMPSPAPRPTDVPVTAVRRLPPSQRPPRTGKARPPYWAVLPAAPDILLDQGGWHFQQPLRERLVTRGGQTQGQRHQETL